MKFRCTLFILLYLPVIVFSQKKSEEKYFPESKGDFKKAAKYYLKKRNVPASMFSPQYASLFSDINDYTTKDTLLALKIINRLYQSDDTLFYRLMRIRLEWDFKQRLLLSSLESVPSFLKNNADSANYCFLLGIFYKDTLLERVARYMGYLKATIEGNEIVDWKNMRKKRVAYPKVLEQLHNYYNPPFVGKNLRDSSFKYYKKAIELDSTQFYYIKEFLIYLYKFGEDTEVQELISSKIDNYSKKEKIWLERLLAISAERKKQMGTTKTWFETL